MMEERDSFSRDSPALQSYRYGGYYVEEETKGGGEGDRREKVRRWHPRWRM